MKNISAKVESEIAKGNVHSDRSCAYNPCHFKGQNCSFCYCPFYPCGDETFGYYVDSFHGYPVWACDYCLFCHRDEVVEFTFGKIKELGLKAGDPRFLSEVFPEARRRFYRPGKAIMVVGATSDAGKSLTVAALGRILSRRGYLVAPFKSQNMSLNSRVSLRGGEMAMIQMLQAQAMGLTVPDLHMNPILLKPKGNSESQVVVEGKPFGDYTARDYYEKFIPAEGEKIVRRNIDFLKAHYDFVLMEGAGSPAEINIYDRDIVNMGAAKIADADCILVVNLEWGGAFAYVAGTMALMPEEDRKRIKMVILNNVRGDIGKVRPVASKLEEICGAPVVGIIPHMDICLPSEDSEALRSMTVRGGGSLRIAVVRFPRIANFTDLDPLYLQDTTVVFAETPEQIRSADAIIIPGTKNTVDDLQWMKDTGIFGAVKEMKGRVPILGICGGYQMMGKVLHDPEGIEGSVPGDHEGLGFFDNETTWGDFEKRVILDHAVMIDGGGAVDGYEIHMGMTDVKEKPMFRMTNVGRKKETEGSVREDEMLYGTFLHGVFDKPAFRKFFLSRIRHDGKPADVPDAEDFKEFVDRNLDILADEFEKNMDLDRFFRIAGVGL